MRKILLPLILMWGMNASPAVVINGGFYNGGGGPAVPACAGGEFLTGNGSTMSCATPAGGGGAVSSVFGRTGAVVAATNDYTFAQIDKTTSSLANLTTRSAGDLSSGTLLDARLSTNVPLKNAANIFTAANTVSVPTTTTVGVTLKSTDDVSGNILLVTTSADIANSAIKSTGAFLAGDGTLALPGLGFFAQPSCGIAHLSSNELDFVCNAAFEAMAIVNAVNNYHVRFEVPLRSNTGNDATAPGYSFHNDADTGMYSAGANIIAWSTGGTSRLSLSDTDLDVIVGNLLFSNGGTIAHTDSAVDSAFINTIESGDGHGLSLNGSNDSVLISGAANTSGEIEIFGSLRISNTVGAVTSLTADDQVVTTVQNSYIRLDSDSAVAVNRTFVLDQGNNGQILLLEWVGTNAAELADNGSVSGGGNVRLSATWLPTQHDTLSLKWNGTDWLETGRSTN